MKKIVLVLMLWFTTNVAQANEAKEIAIIDFIVDNSPSVRAARQHRGLDIKLDARASGNVGVIGQYTDRAAVGMSLTIPLLDTREKRELEKKAAEEESQIRQKAVNAISKYSSSIRQLNYLTELINYETNVLNWYRERVRQGIDYQKDLIQYEAKHRQTLEQRGKARQECKEALLTLMNIVEKGKRQTLGRQIVNELGRCEDGAY